MGWEEWAVADADADAVDADATAVDADATAVDADATAADRSCSMMRRTAKLYVVSISARTWAEYPSLT
jgi:hypothetical protein